MLEAAPVCLSFHPLTAGYYYAIALQRPFRNSNPRTVVSVTLTNVTLLSDGLLADSVTRVVSENQQMRSHSQPI